MTFICQNAAFALQKRAGLPAAREQRHPAAARAARLDEQVMLQTGSF